MFAQSVEKEPPVHGILMRKEKFLEFVLSVILHSLSNLQRDGLKAIKSSSTTGRLKRRLKVDSIKTNDLVNCDIISVSRKCTVMSYFSSPISTYISKKIQKILSDTEAGNEKNVNHTALVMDGYVWEIHCNGLKKTKICDYFDKGHDYYVSRIPHPIRFDKVRTFLDYVFYHQHGKVGYDTFLIFKILNHVRKNRPIELLKTDVKDLDYICSELVQIALEAGTSDFLAHRVLLPNDFPKMYSTIKLEV